MPSASPATSSATMRSASSSATTSSAATGSRPPRRHSRPGAWGAGTLLYEVPDPERFGVAEFDTQGRVVGFEEKPAQPKSEPHPDRRLLPPPGRLRRHRGACAVGSRRVRDHRRAQPLHPRRRPVHRGLHGHVDGCRHGAEPAARRRAGRARRRRRLAPAAGRLARRAARDRPPSTARAPAPARHGRRGVHRLELVRQLLGRARRDAGHRPRQAHLRRQPGQPRRGRGRPRAGARGYASSRATSPTRRPSGRSSPRPTPSSTSPPRPTSTAASSTRRRSCAPASSASTSCSRRSARRPPRGRDARSRFLQVSTDEVYGDIAEGRCVETDPLAPRSPYAAAKAVERAARPRVPCHVRPRHRHHPRLEHVRPAPAPREAHPAVRHQRPRRRAAADVRRRHAGPRLAPRADHAAGIDFVLRHGEPGETYNLPGGTELPNRDVIGRLLAAAGRDWSLVRTVPDRPGHDRRYAMDGSKLRALGWAPEVPFERRACPRPSPGTATTRRGSRRRRAATGRPTTSASTRAGSRRAGARTSRRSRQADRCGSRSPAPAAGWAGR